MTRALAVAVTVLVLVACGGEQEAPTTAAGEGSSSTTRGDVDLDIGFTTLPDGWVEAETGTMGLLSIGGDQAGEPTASTGARRTGSTEAVFSVAVWAGGAAIAEQYEAGGTMKASALRDGAASVSAHERGFFIVWAEDGHGVFANAANVSEDELALLVDAVRISA